MWTFAAATLFNHILPGVDHLDETAFQKALSDHAEAVDTFCNLLGIIPSSLESLCEKISSLPGEGCTESKLRTSLEASKRFEIASLLVALVELGQSTAANFIVTITPAPPSDGEEADSFKVQVSNIAGEVKT